MSLLNNRTNNDSILEQRFIDIILKEEADNINKAQEKLMRERGFTSIDFYSDRMFSIANNELTYQHLKKHRYVDMRYKNKDNTKTKKSFHPIHNKILMGHSNNIIFRLQVEYTDRMRQMIMSTYPDLKTE